MARLVKRYQLLVFLSLMAASTTVTVVHARIDSLGLPCGMRDECGFLPSLACINGVCAYCHTDDECSTVGEAIHRCHPVQGDDQNSGGLCFEKDLFDPFTPNDVLATVITLVATALGSGCGVGGGGLLVPAFILVIGLSPKHAIPLSKAAIFGNAVATYFFNVFRKHPLKKNVPLINYDVASIMEPTTLIGSVVGVMLNHILPDWLILVLLVSFLAYTTKHSFLKGEEIRFAEALHQQALIRQVLTGNKSGGGQGAWSVLKRFDWEAAGRHWLTLTRRNRRLRALLAADQADFKSLPPLPEDATPLLLASEMASPAFGTFGASGSDDAASSEIRQRLQRREADVFPLRTIFPLLMCWLIVLFQALLRGGHGSASLIGVQCNTLAYWGLTIAPLLVLVLITWRVGYRLRLENRLRVFSGYDFLPSDIHWTKPHVTTFPLLCTAAGVAAGLLGIGGGMVKSPLMLEMGILPAVQTATAGYMVLFTASATTLQFAIGGQFPGALQYDYAAWFALVGFFGGLCGQSLVSFIVKKYKRESIMVYILAGTIGVSTVAMGLVGLSNVLDDLERGVGVGFNSLCGNA